MGTATPFGAKKANLLSQYKRADETAVFVTECPHPIWPNLRLVIWRLADGDWSLDALAPDQWIGTALPSTADQREAILRGALLRTEKKASTS